MLWVLYALLSGFFWATSDAITKKLPVNTDKYILTWSRFLFSIPFLLILLFFIPIPNLDISFLYILIISIIVEITEWILYVKAITSAPLSLTVPFLTFTPVFIIITSFIILGELPTVIGLVGILLVAMGAYILNFKTNKDLLEPFKTMFKEKAILLMIIAAFLFSITGVLGKILVQKSSPLFFSAIYFPAIALFFIPIILIKSRKKLFQIKKAPKQFFLVGFFFGLMGIFNMLAVILTIVPYMISVKRTSSLFGVLYGIFLFKEKFAFERILGTVIMLLGVAFITLF